MNPVKPSTQKVDLSPVSLTFQSGNPADYPFAYVDNLWDVVMQNSEMAALAECTGQFIQHDINELFAERINKVLGTLGTGAVYLGAAGLATQPSDEVNGFYLVLTAGTYQNFLDEHKEALTVSQGEIALFVTDGTGWSKQHILTAPYIDPSTKHWVVDGVETNVLAEGQNGQAGAPGASAYQLAVQYGYKGTVQQWLESLKATIGSFKFTPYDANAGITAIGDRVTVFHENDQNELPAGPDTLDVIVLMPNAATGTTATMMFSTEESTTTIGEYVFVYVGDLSLDANQFAQKTEVDKLIYDVTANNPTAGPSNDGSFASLSELLSDQNIDTLIPTNIRTGGMSIKFVQTSENKYEQYRLMSDTFNTTPANWQGVDDEPTAGSNNLVKSGGVKKSLVKLDSKTGLNAVTNCLFYNVLNVEDSDYVPNKIIRNIGSFFPNDYDEYFTSGYIECSAGMRFRGVSTASMKFYVCFYTKDKTAISSAYIEQTALYFEVPDNDAIAYMRVSMKKNDAKGCLFNSDVVFDTYVEYNKPIIVCEHMTGEYIKNELLNGIESRFATNIFNPEDEDIVDGYYINPTNGEIVESQNYFITGFIPCKCGDYLAWNGRTTSQICALYDRNKTYINSYFEGDLNPYNTIPFRNNGNIAYARFSVPNSYKQKALYKNSYSAGYIGYGLTALIIDDVFLPDSLVQRLQSLLQSINALDERVENIEKQITIVTNVLNQADERYVNEKILNKNTGGFLSGTNAGYMTTGFIPCKKGDKFTLYNKQKAEFWVCCYDSNKTFISGTGSQSNVYEIVIPNNDSIRYFRTSYKISTKDKYLYNTGSKISIKKEYGESFLLFDYVKATDLQADSIEASQIVLNGKDLSKRETRWEFACCRPICIGDSLTDGLYGDTSKGLINENYPYFLGRMLDCEVFNAGKNGSYPSKFYSEWYPSLDFTDYDSVFLWFGTNRGLDTADSSAASGSPANEGYYYKQIIDGILSQNSSIKITLLTVFTVGGDGNVTDTNNFINATAVEYGLQVVDMSDLWVTGPYGLKIHANESNTHFGKAGNILIADRIVNELSDWFESDLLRCEFGITTKSDHTP